MLHPILQPVLQPVLRSPFDRPRGKRYEWVLLTGLWNDSGTWLDEQTWNDGV